MSDDVDNAEPTREAHFTESMRVHNLRPKAEYDSEGCKVCIDCGVNIPPERAAIDVVVRCLECQEISELEAKRW